MRRFVVLWILGLLVASPGWTQATKSDRDALVGTWKITSFLDDDIERLARLGVEAGKPNIAKIVFTADECFVIRGDGKRQLVPSLMNCSFRAYKLDEKAKSIDLVLIDGKGGERVAPGIYKIDGDKLLIAWNEEKTEPRPSKLISDAAMNLFVCERLSTVPEKRP